MIEVIDAERAIRAGVNRQAMKSAKPAKILTVRLRGGGPAASDLGTGSFHDRVETGFSADRGFNPLPGELLPAYWRIPLSVNQGAILMIESIIRSRVRARMTPSATKSPNHSLRVLTSEDNRRHPANEMCRAAGDDKGH